MNRSHTLIVGIGNRYRGDDAFGCIVAGELAGQVPRGVTCIEHDGEPAGLMECWQGAENVLLVDAVSSGARAGQVFRFDLARQALPEEFNLYSTHAFGVAQAVELARALGKLPRHMRFIGVEGENFDAGEELSPALSKAKNAIISEISNSLAAQTGLHT
jgi:hydrogenase maturation protease